MTVSVDEREAGALRSEKHYRVVDMDSHLMEPESMWPQYLAVRYRELAPRRVVDSEGYPHLCAAGITLGRDVKPRPTPSGPPEAGGFDPQARLQAMDDEGVEAMVMYPTTALKFAAIPDLDVVGALSRAYNSWAIDFRAAAPHRLLPMAAVPQASLEGTLAETRWAVGEMGMPGIFLRPNPIGRTLDDPAWEPLWSLLEELDAPLALHEGTSGATVPAFGDDRTDNFMFRHMMSHPFEMMQAMLMLIGGGVLDRHPRLRVCFVEAGCGWVPFWLERMEHHVREWAHVTFPLKSTPTEQFRRQCFVSADAEEIAGVRAAVGTIGPEGICWTTDYPHPDHSWKGIAKGFLDRTDISDDAKAMIIGGNAIRAYKL